jgi:geranylgeranyl pyrophosphate synthase
MNFLDLDSQYQSAIALAYQGALESLPNNSPLRDMVSYQFHTGGKRLRPLAAILAAKTIRPDLSDGEIMLNNVSRFNISTKNCPCTS